MRKCLSLAGPVRIANFEEWTQFLDEDLTRVTPSPTSLRSTEIQPRGLRPVGEFDVDAAKETIAAYITLSGEMKLVAKAAIDRFDRAVRRHDPGDAAVELATALEGMLGGDGNGELTWKVSFRSALVAGGSIETRTRVRAIVHSLYDLRSKVVHTDITPTKKIAVKGGVAMSADALVNEGLSVVSLILRGGLKMETKPDWFTMELG